jgi:hypothetical protein
MLRHNPRLFTASRRSFLTTTLNYLSAGRFRRVEDVIYSYTVTRLRPAFFDANSAWSAQAIRSA